MLLNNFHVTNINPGREIGGPSNPVWWAKAGSMAHWYYGDANVTQQTERDSIPSGYVPPYSFVLSPKAGSIACRYEMNGAGDMTAALTSGKNCEVTLTGSGDLVSPNLSLVVQLAATILGSGGLSASLSGTVQLAATLAGSGDIDAALGAIAWITSTLSGSGTIDESTNLTGIAHMSADITPFTELSPESLAAAVWDALAEEFDSPGSTGERLNKLLTKLQFLALK